MAVYETVKVRDLGVLKVENGKQFYIPEQNELSIPNDLVLRWAKFIKREMSRAMEDENSKSN